MCSVCSGSLKLHDNIDGREAPELGRVYKEDARRCVSGVISFCLDRHNVWLRRTLADDDVVRACGRPCGHVKNKYHPLNMTFHSPHIIRMRYIKVSVCEHGANARPYTIIGAGCFIIIYSQVCNSHTSGQGRFAAGGRASKAPIVGSRAQTNATHI